MKIDKKYNARYYQKRLLVTFFIAFAFVFGISELAHIINKEQTDRIPEIIEFVIPAGTAKKIAAGEQVAIIPSGLTFVIGDTLSIKNEDTVNHELGPLYIPTGSSASLVMEDANKYTLGCSFQTSKYFNFDVRTRTTFESRITALMLATPPTTVFLFLYSILIFPAKRNIENKEDEDENV